MRYAGRNIVYDAANLYPCDTLNFSESLYVLTAVEPSEPLNLRFDPSIRYKNSLIFRWDAPRAPGGSPLQTYTLEIENISTGTTEQILLTVQAHSYRFDNLASATDYGVSIKVNNLVGESDWTEQVVARTGIVPTRPGILSFDATTRTTI